jgi:DNA-binding NarL/FixJ family response regulator
MDYVHGRSVITIAFADDDELLQDLLTIYINSIENCKVVIQAYTGKELLEKLTQRPNTSLVLMDIKMPEMDGIEAAKEIKYFYPGMKILFTSIYKNEIVYCRIIGAGGDGYVNKKSEPQEFNRAIFTIMKSGHYFQDYVSSDGKSKLQPLNGKHKISEEEIRFLKLICTDKTYTGIAGEMNTNLRHIDYIREGLFEKFEARNRVELALLAYNGGI